MSKTCLNCKYQPDWKATGAGEYARQFGICKFDKLIPILPQPWFITRNGIQRYKDDSGVMTNCKTWEKA